MARIDRSQFSSLKAGLKLPTRDRKKRQRRFVFETLDTSKWEGVSKYVPIVHPDQAKLAQEIMEGNLTTGKWADEEATEFDFGGTP